jgi:hypothetical protein
LWVIALHTALRTTGNPISRDSTLGFRHRLDTAFRRRRDAVGPQQLLRLDLVERRRAREPGRALTPSLGQLGARRRCEEISSMKRARSRLANRLDDAQRLLGLPQHRNMRHGVSHLPSALAEVERERRKHRDRLADLSRAQCQVLKDLQIRDAPFDAPTRGNSSATSNTSTSGAFVRMSRHDAYCALCKVRRVSSGLSTSATPSTSARALTVLDENRASRAPVRSAASVIRLRSAPEMLISAIPSPRGIGLRARNSTASTASSRAVQRMIPAAEANTSKTAVLPAKAPVCARADARAASEPPILTVTTALPFWRARRAALRNPAGSGTDST